MSSKVNIQQKENISFSFWLKKVAQSDYQVVAFQIKEALSSLTRIDILLASSVDMAFSDHLGATASLCVQSAALPKPTYFSGIIRSRYC